MKAYRYRFYPTSEQKVLLARTFGSCRFIWNFLLAENKEQYAAFLRGEAERPRVDFPSLSRRLTEIKQQPEYSWLKEPFSGALQTASENLAKAFKSGFRRDGTGLPKFKKKHAKKKSFTVAKPRVFRYGEEFFLPKDKQPLKIKWTRPLPRDISRYTVSQTSDGKYWISFNLVPGDNDRVITNGTGSIGIDLGIKDLVIDSNGVKYDNPKWLKMSQERLR